jgi:uncharacterized membrane protein YphA (DoxX/SURF4 family)
MNRVLWVVQVLLALLFAFAGAMKFIMPMDQMTKQMPVALAPGFIYFIGVAEILGAIGLILPRLLNIRPGLTPLAAAGLAIIMVGATWITLSGGPSMAALPFITGLLCIFVAWGRSRVAR